MPHWLIALHHREQDGAELATSGLASIWQVCLCDQLTLMYSVLQALTASECHLQHSVLLHI